jgi:AcrR family transcriptional regulator
MHAKRFDDISVQDIAEAATVNRATFYDHYTDKFALLEAMVGGGFHELLDARQVRYDVGCPAALGAIVQAACDYLSLAHSGGNCERQTAFEPLMDAAIVSAIRRLVIEGMQRAEYASSIPLEMVATSTSWAIYGGVKQWFSAPNRSSAETMVPQMLELILPMLEAAGMTKHAV